MKGFEWAVFVSLGGIDSGAAWTLSVPQNAAATAVSLARPSRPCHCRIENKRTWAKIHGRNTTPGTAPTSVDKSWTNLTNCRSEDRGLDPVFRSVVALP